MDRAVDCTRSKKMAEGNESLPLFSDTVHSILFFLDASTIARLLCTCQHAKLELKREDTLKWISSVRSMNLPGSFLPVFIHHHHSLVDF